MHYLGEVLSLAVALFWTVTALCFEYASKRTGALPLNLIRLVMALVMLGLLLTCLTGSPLPLHADSATWFWLAISGLIGFVFGDFCLFYAYVRIGSRFTQLMMTLAPPAAAIGGTLILNQRLSGSAILGMVVTLTGIVLSIVGKGDGDGSRIRLKLPVKGLLLAVGAGIGQGIGIVFSKLGMDHYTLSLTAAGAEQKLFELIPFAASQIRIITGIVGFTLLLLFSGKIRELVPAFRQRKAMGIAAVGTFFGPFVGVSLSLMAVQYTDTGIASTLMALTPIMILLPAHYLYRQKITSAEIIGAVISVIGVSIFFIG